jgi:hypothetical protein
MGKSCPSRHMGVWRYSSTIIDFCTTWRRVVGFRPRRLYSRGNVPRYPFDKRLVGPQRRSGLCGEQKNFLPLPGIEPQPFSPQLLAILTEVSVQS